MEARSKGSEGVKGVEAVETVDVVNVIDREFYVSLAAGAITMV